MSEDNRAPWTVAFGHSRVVPLMFPVHRQHADRVLDVLDELGVESFGTGISMYESSTSAYPLLDGAVSVLSTYGLPPMPSGVRVLGTRPLRLLCHVMELRPPSRRLKYESRIPPPDELMAELAAQRTWGLNALRIQAMHALFQDTDGAVEAVRALFGPQAA